MNQDRINDQARFLQETGDIVAHLVELTARIEAQVRAAEVEGYVGIIKPIWIKIDNLANITSGALQVARFNRGRIK